MEGVHIERQAVQLPINVRHRRIGIAVELGKTVYKIPTDFGIGMEDVSAVLVDPDPLHLFRIDVSGNMTALFHHEAAFPRFPCQHRKRSRKKSRTNK